MRWLPSAPEADVVTRAEAEAAARQAAASIGIEAIDLGIHPRGDTAARMSVVGWNTWLWAESPSSTQWGTMSTSATAAGITVSLNASSSQVTWSMGDGATVSCGQGTRWTMAGTGGRNVPSPDCGYVYDSEGRYTVTASTDWSIDWSAAGYSGTIPLEVRRSAEVIVGEMQSVNLAGA
ncbi:hypothetical protein RPIT_01960 [Tessaracoccus flavus]|uniref:PKD domain-containing protein n=1 Tax=Tessaracoccus flavus TaxID=1610493 RepID=A0A1Q2CCF2_9ACTN|nr:hypothetical protein RPIT_01960 [Tessaracoccus flavus]